MSTITNFISFVFLFHFYCHSFVSDKLVIRFKLLEGLFFLKIFKYAYNFIILCIFRKSGRFSPSKRRHRGSFCGNVVKLLRRMSGGKGNTEASVVLCYYYY